MWSVCDGYNHGTAEGVGEPNIEASYEPLARCRCVGVRGLHAGRGLSMDGIGVVTKIHSDGSRDAVVCRRSQ